jgi:hypothetical protein
MSFLRQLGIVICAIILFLLLIFAGISGTLNYSLSYENVQSNINPILKQVIEEQIEPQVNISELIYFAQIVCLTEKEITQEFENYTFILPCETINLGKDNVINYIIDYLIKEIYYKEYTCEFLNCFEEQNIPLFLISSHAKIYWQSIFYKTLIFMLAIIFLIFLLVEKKANGLILVGSLSLISSFILLKLKIVGINIIRGLLSQQNTSNINLDNLIPKIINIFLSESENIFLFMFIISLILIILGIILKKIIFKKQIVKN